MTPEEAISRIRSRLAGEWFDPNGDLESDIKSVLDELDNPIDWKAVAIKQGWREVTHDPEGEETGPCLHHAEQDRIWPLGDWRGACHDLGIDNAEAREILAEATQN